MMSKQVGQIKLFSTKDLHAALGVNERTVRDWFNKGRLKGQKLSGEWHCTEENLRLFLSGEEGSVRAIKRKKTAVKKKGKGR
jgi:predicted site-specific integrase-resolvase